MKKSPQMVLWHSVFWIVGSALVTSSIGYKILHQGLFLKPKKTDLAQTISYIVQTGLQKEALHSDYLAEIMGLSIDKPIAFSEFDEELFLQKLASSPVIQKAKMKKIPPNMIYVDYAVRKPIAWAADFVNMAIDKEGYLFPIQPFFSPKKIPEIFLGEKAIAESCKEISFQEPLRGKYIDLSLQILTLLSDQGKDLFQIKKIDVSKAFAETLGKREIVIVLENEIGENISTHFLRLSSKHFPAELANYLSLRTHLLETDKQDIGDRKGIHKQKIVDLRLPQLAFIK